MRKGIIYGAGAVVLAGVVAFGLYAWHPEIAEVSPPSKGQFPPELVEQGRILAAAGYCSTCHTAAGGQPYAGNYKMNTAFGTIYSSNITPDPQTGIGRWSEDAFIRAMRTGVDREGSHLLPAFPYEHFNKMTDHDIRAIYAYIMTSVAPVQQQKLDNGIPFPLNIRWLQAGWKLLFADNEPFKERTDKSAEWNRGAYLAEGVSHCGACHTPRNVLGGEKYSHAFEGAAVDGWFAPSLTTTSTSPIRWRQADFYRYLTTGNSPWHGSAAGPMSPVIHGGLSALPDSDIHAISVFLADLAGNATDDPTTSQPLAVALKREHQVPDLRTNDGARLYATACAACHYNGETVKEGRPLLGIVTATHLDDPVNLINVIMDGIRSDQGTRGIVMPSFRDALTDDQISEIAAWLRQSAGEKPWPDLKQRVAEIRKQPRFEH